MTPCVMGSSVLLRRLPAVYTHSNMLWFLKTLSETTTEDIELRVCGNFGVDDEDTLLQMVEVFAY